MAALTLAANLCHLPFVNWVSADRHAEVRKPRKGRACVYPVPPSSEYESSNTFAETRGGVPGIAI
jgi:hypothetical protein